MTFSENEFPTKCKTDKNNLFYKWEDFNENVIREWEITLTIRSNGSDVSPIYTSPQG